MLLLLYMIYFQYPMSEAFIIREFFLATLCLFWKMNGLNATLRAIEIEVENLMETLNQLKPKDLVKSLIG